MSTAGQALRQALELHNISQNRLALALGVERPIVFRWFHGQIDPTGESIVQITQALKQLDPNAANSFIDFYLGNLHQGSASTTSAHSLPPSSKVNISALAQLFNNTTNSYKYLFFLSLLDILRRRNFDINSPISFIEIVIEMLANAWFPHTYFTLSFGNQDKITEKLDSLNLVVSEPILKFNDPDKQHLRQTIQSHTYGDLVKFIVKYVPFRLIRPFFSQETRGLKDADVNQTILEIANRNKEQALYFFDADLVKDCNAIIFSRSWTDYIEENFSIVKGWISWEWLQYMQARNPTTPNIVNKIFMPQQRGSLSHQTKFWKSVLAYQHLNCIYSGQAINPDRLSLDHYLPWSFVAHDQLWNLAPVVPEVNSAKSNSLPAEQYFPRFVSLQHLALVTYHKHLTDRHWERVIEPYVADLNLSSNDLLEQEKLFKAYELTVQPLMTLAEKQGFSRDWSYTG